MQPFGGMELSVDGRRIDIGQTLAYRGVMISGVPNLAAVFGYINSSWTLKADLICSYVCRILNHMDSKGARQVTPVPANNEKPVAPSWKISAQAICSEPSPRGPNKAHNPPLARQQNYFRDTLDMKWTSLDDGALIFTNPKVRSIPDRQLVESAR